MLLIFSCGFESLLHQLRAGSSALGLGHSAPVPCLLASSQPSPIFRVRHLRDLPTVFVRKAQNRSKYYSIKSEKIVVENYCFIIIHEYLCSYLYLFPVGRAGFMRNRWVCGQPLWVWLAGGMAAGDGSGAWPLWVFLARPWLHGRSFKSRFPVTLSAPPFRGPP